MAQRAEPTTALWKLVTGFRLWAFTRSQEAHLPWAVRLERELMLKVLDEITTALEELE